MVPIIMTMTMTMTMTMMTKRNGVLEEMASALSRLKLASERDLAAGSEEIHIDSCRNTSKLFGEIHGLLIHVHGEIHEDS